MKIKELRTNTLSKPEDIAKMLNISVQAYYKYENGKNEPNIENLCKLADHYQVSVDYLIGHNLNNDIGHLSQQEKEFVKAYLMLNQQNKIKIAGYALGLLAGQDENE